MITIQKQFASRIEEFILQVPDEFVVKIAAALQEGGDREWRFLRSHVIKSIPTSAVQEQLEDLLDFWYINLPEIGADGLALALLSAAQADAHHRRKQTIELVWTGPESRIIPLRRSDQALLQLIEEAQHRILIVSFAVYKVQNIIDALIRAGKRGASVTILVESPEDDQETSTYHPIQAFGAEIHSYAKFFIWPVDKRPLSPDGRHGSLHAKIAAADGHTMLISSANLTEYAMNLNMEMGVLIRGGSLPTQVEQHFKEMIETGIIQPVED